jgi:hypothetical protein
LAALDGPRQQRAAEGSAQPSSPPNGETTVPGERRPVRPAAPGSSPGGGAVHPGASGSAGPSMSETEQRWLQQERRRRGLGPDDRRPNPTVPRR